MWEAWMEHFNEIKSNEKNNFNFMETGAMQGWQCPMCKRVLAPFVQECPCKGQGISTITIATTNSKGADNIE